MYHKRLDSSKHWFAGLHAECSNTPLDDWKWSVYAFAAKDEREKWVKDNVPYARALRRRDAVHILGVDKHNLFAWDSEQKHKVTTMPTREDMDKVWKEFYKPKKEDKDVEV